MAVVSLPHKFQARPYQAELLDAFFKQHYKHVYWILHRRAGKDKTCINILVGAACLRVGTYLYLFPQTNQARRVVWKGLDGDGMRFLDHIPQALIAKQNATDMSVQLINGSVIQLGGSNNYDALMGSNPVGIIYSEFPLHNPLARQYLSPILVENKGWEILQGTPRGKNHGHKVYQAALQNPKWYVKRLTIEDTLKSDGSPVITLEQIEDERKNGMSEEMIRQEFYCDFNVGTVGAYYTQEMDKAEYDGRICNFEINPKLPVYTAWDIGVSDPTCIVFFQKNGDTLDFIHYIEKTDQGIEYYVRQLAEVKQRFGISYAYHFGPHDLNQRKWNASARSSLSIAQDLGLHFMICPNVGIDNGIQAVKAFLPMCRFHATNCATLIDALKEYRREWDEVNRVFKSHPLHNWASHCFSGDTHVLTRHGTCQIMDLPFTGEVLTLCGWKAYRNPRITQKNAPLVAVTFKDGLTVRCTPEHLFLTDSGWKYAKDLMKGSSIQSSLTHLHNTSMADSIGYGPKSPITPEEANTFTGKFGKMLLGLFRRGITFTTKMITQQTTCYLISSAYPPKSICLTPGISTNVGGPNTSPLSPVSAPTNGTNLKQEGSGIRGLLSAQKPGKYGKGRTSHACSVRPLFQRWLEKMGIRKNSAPTTARQLIIESVKEMPDNEDVWCLTVPDVEHFSLANGAVVHNCADSMRYAAVQWRDLFTRPEQNAPRKYQSDFSLKALR